MAYITVQVPEEDSTPASGGGEFKKFTQVGDEAVGRFMSHRTEPRKNDDGTINPNKLKNIYSFRGAKGDYQIDANYNLNIQLQAALGNGKTKPERPLTRGMVVVIRMSGEKKFSDDPNMSAMKLFQVRYDPDSYPPKRAPRPPPKPTEPDDMPF